MVSATPLWTCARNYFVAVATLAVIAPAAAQPTCHYTWDRIRLPDVYCVGWDINNNGHVAGEIDTGGDASRAFYWTPEGGVEILPLPPGVITMSAYAINDHDQIAGIMGDGNWYGFVWHPVDGYTIIDFPNPSANVYVTDINDSGEVVGSVYRRVIPAPWEWEPFVWQNGEFEFFGSFFGPTPAFARGINDHGDIVGFAYEPGASDTSHAFVIGGENTFAWLPEPMGFTKSTAEAINNHGVVVGYGRNAIAGQREALIWSAGGITTVAPIPGTTAATLIAVNDLSIAIGYFEASPERSFRWQLDSVTLFDELIQSAPATVGFSQELNDYGQVLITGGNSTLLLESQWLPTDITGDCSTQLEDLAVLLVNFGMTSNLPIVGDLDSNGTVGLTDLAILLAAFGE